MKGFMELGSREREGADGVKRFGGFSPWERTGKLLWSRTGAECPSLLHLLSHAALGKIFNDSLPVFSCVNDGQK